MMPERQRTTPKSPTSPIRAGLILGLQAALCLSIGYAVLGTLIVDILTESQMSLILLTFGLPAIGLLAIAPAVCYGIFTGVVLGFLAGEMAGRTSRFAFMVLSITICLAIAAASHFLCGIKIVLSFEPSDMYSGIYGSYLFYIGFPTFIYILTGGWAGWRLYAKALGYHPHSFLV
jgi:hypothetical protein